MAVAVLGHPEPYQISVSGPSWGQLQLLFPSYFAAALQVIVESQEPLGPAAAAAQLSAAASLVTLAPTGDH